MSEVIPVVLFAYRRADLLRRALASLRANDVPLIYAFSDGPRDAEVAAEVAEVRAELRAVDWTRIEIAEASVNLGVATAELQGIEGVLEHHEMAVMVEEDLEFGPGTYDFICAGLRHYRNDSLAMGVTAWNHPRLTPAGVTQPYFTGRMSGLMWGTWKRAWSGMLEATALKRLQECRAKGIDPSRYGDDLLHAPADDEAKGMWDLRFNLHMLARDGLFLFPALSMVRHTGYDARATNSPDGTGWTDVVSMPPNLAEVRWPAVLEHPGSAAPWRTAMNAPRRTWLSRIKRRFDRWRKR